MGTGAPQRPSLGLSRGTMVTPRVRLLEPLDRGGMAELWIAEHLSLGSRVVVKFVSAELVQSDVVVERFHREAQAAARIKNPHVVQLFDHGCMPDGTPFIVMELLVGETLGQGLERVGSIDVATTADIVMQLADGLAAAHEAGVVHRDVKPDNIFLCHGVDGPLVKLLDFGVAAMRDERRVPKLTRRGVVVGTPYYLSPERIDGGARRDPMDDLWALAVVAYEALTGVVPFDGDTVDLVLRRIGVGRFVRPSLLTEVEPRVDAWFERAFHPEAHQRFTTARAFANSFAELVAPPIDTSIARSAPPTVPIVGRRMRRTRSAIIVASAALVGLSVWGLSLSPGAATAAAGLAPWSPPPPQVHAAAPESHAAAPLEERTEEERRETPSRPARRIKRVAEAPPATCLPTDAAPSARPDYGF